VHSRPRPRPRLRGRVLVLTVASAAAAVVLAGCGSGTSSATTASAGLDSVKITGDIGGKTTVTFDGKVDQTSTTTKVLTQGNGAKIQQGDSVIVSTTVADGYTQKTVYSDQQPQMLQLSSQVQPIFLSALQGKTVGSRVLLSAPADKIFGPQGNPQLNISNKDTVLFVFDIVGKPLAGPDGAKHPAPSWAPKTQTTKGVLSGLDFRGTPKPDGTLKSATLRDGTGAKVKKGQTIYAQYLGQVYGGKKPFDENFSSGQPATFTIGTGNVIKGWDKSLVGQRVGSEVVLAIPPQDGYGSKGQPSAGIKGNDTLYFVVDILGAV
jgi:peptidylprolyl isomerase